MPLSSSTSLLPPARRLLGAAAILAVGLLAGCTGSTAAKSPTTATRTDAPSSSPGTATATPASTPDVTNLYGHDGVGMFSPNVAGARSLVYVPDLRSNDVYVIDQRTMKVIDHFPVGREPQHVVPGWDLRTLYVTNDQGNSLTPIDPKTGRPSGGNIPVSDPYNMYFTPDGASAIVVAEAQQRLDFRDPHTFALQQAVPVACKGVDHIDFSADGSYLIATCEFAGKLVKVDVHTHRVVGYLDLGGMPQDIKIDPQGKVWYVADMMNNGVDLIDGNALRKVGFIPTGPETHGLYPSRDAKYLYISNRGGPHDQGSVTVLDFATRQIVAQWPIAPPSTPDMGNISADGKVLWLSGRRTNEVYAIDTTDGHLLARIRVGLEPHGLCVWPEPGRYSLGHTGILR